MRRWRSTEFQVCDPRRSAHFTRDPGERAYRGRERRHLERAANTSDPVWEILRGHLGRETE
jgi:hypothetical protein